jgi:glutamyl-tRNA reductase
LVDSSTAPLWCISAAGGPNADRRAEIATQLTPLSERGGAVLISTCQRVELYGDTLPAPSPPPGSTTFRSEAAVRHLFRVAAGLESAAVGEAEILGQVRRAFAGAGQLNGRLTRLFTAAIATGRRCRAGKEPSGSSLAAVAARSLLDLVESASPTLLVIGAGYMGRALTAAMAPRCAELVVASRSLDRAAAVAGTFGATAVRLDEAANLAPEVSGLAVALAAKWPAQFEPRSLAAVVDVSSPPALDSKAARYYVGVDELLSAAGRQSRSSDYAARAERVVEAEVAAYLDAVERRRLKVAV